MLNKILALLKERSLWMFLLVGVGNTLLSMLLMLLLYEQLGLGYWGSSALAFVLGSAFSFIMNRRFSFKSRGNLWGDLARFVLVIAACYLVAFSLSRPLIREMLKWRALTFLAPWADQIAMIAGNVIFTALNYFGQRFFAFRNGGR